jgi:hypothetical protein
LDIAFCEDERRQQDRYGRQPGHGSPICGQPAMPTQTISNGAKAKRMKAALDSNYLLYALKHGSCDAEEASLHYDAIAFAPTTIKRLGVDGL